MTHAADSRHLTIEVLYFAGCPNHQRAVALVRRALVDEHITAPIQMIRVDTDEEAQLYSFYGSPSIRVNGKDVAPLPAGATPGLACRVYQTADGRLTPAPSYEALVAALRRGAETTASHVPCTTAARADRSPAGHELENGPPRRIISGRADGHQL